MLGLWIRSNLFFFSEDVLDVVFNDVYAFLKTSPLRSTMLSAHLQRSVAQKLAPQ